MLFFPDAEPLQPQGIGNDGDGAQRHRRARENRGEQRPAEGVEQTRGERNADDVVGKRPEEVLADV
ncbi:hypothetical protein SDC9_63157 [bioreactor metagenome]|uniref:Uncharacterized protein n=1 Tax=bioreactor metagenome TaxID=1076179 RepID=A0A644XKR7_9ZZZZ